MKYKLEDAKPKKFLVEKFLDYKMIDIKLVANQIEELQIIISDQRSEGMDINESFQVAVVIEKLTFRRTSNVISNTNEKNYPWRTSW